MTHLPDSGTSFLVPESGIGFWYVCHCHKARVADVMHDDAAGRRQCLVLYELPAAAAWYDQTTHLVFNAGHSHCPSKALQTGDIE